MNCHEANKKVLNGRNFFVFEDIDVISTIFCLKFNLLKNVYLTLKVVLAIGLGLWRSRFVLSFNLFVISKWIGKTRQLGAYFFFSFVTRTAYWRTESSCVIRRCAVNRKKNREIKFGNYRRCKFGPHCLLAQQASLRQYIGTAQVYQSLILQQISWTLLCRVLPIRQDITCTYWFCFTEAETEMHKIKDDSKINREKNIDRRGPRQSGIVWHIPDHPSFSLPTTFNATMTFSRSIFDLRFWSWKK